MGGGSACSSQPISTVHEMVDPGVMAKLDGTKIGGAWHAVAALPPRNFVCGFCDRHVASNQGFATNGATPPFHLYICSGCSAPSLFNSASNKQWPSPPVGVEVPNLPTNVDRIFREVREACSAGATTAAALTLRVLISHLAVEKGAEKGKSFKQHVQYLADNHWMPPNAQPWIDRIRDRGNEANHDLDIIELAEVTELLKIAELLLRFMFQYPVPPA